MHQIEGIDTGEFKNHGVLLRIAQSRLLGKDVAVQEAQVVSFRENELGEALLTGSCSLHC